jgi:hypothetical protein
MDRRLAYARRTHGTVCFASNLSPRSEDLKSLADSLRRKVFVGLTRVSCREFLDCALIFVQRFQAIESHALLCPNLDIIVESQILLLCLRKL